MYFISESKAKLKTHEYWDINWFTHWLTHIPVNTLVFKVCIPAGFLRIKPIARLIFKCKILGSHTISDQSLLLSTIVLNDNDYITKCILYLSPRQS